MLLLSEEYAENFRRKIPFKLVLQSLIDLNGEDFRGCRQRVNSMKKGKEIGEYGKYRECMGTSMCVIVKGRGKWTDRKQCKKIRGA